MELKEKLGGFTHISTKKRANKWLIYALGLFGITAIILAGWLSLNDWRYFGVTSEAKTEGRQAVEDLMQPILALK
uniref:hypothetical protein n=1 Tax=Ectopseudomonas oleovorans TaxID=301 RepID=UPI00241DCA49